MDPRITRLENNLWGYIPEVSFQQQATEESHPLTQIQITTPCWNAPKLSYMFAKAVAQSLQDQQISTLEQLENDLTLTIENNDPNLNGKWDISLVRHNEFIDQLRDYFPMTKVYRDKQIAVLTAAPAAPEPIKTVQKLFTGMAQSREHLISAQVTAENAVLPVARTLQEQLATPLFQDAFTNLAAITFQTTDPYFVSEEKVLAAYRYVFTENGSLELQEIAPGEPTEEQKAQNKEIVQFYKNFIVTNFGKETLLYVSQAYGFSFDDLIQKGDPLVPDHVFKTNIGANNVELGDVQHMYNMLAAFKASPGPVDMFPLMELRKLARKITGDNITPLTTELLTLFVNDFVKDDISSVKKLPVDSFNQLVDLVMPTDEERELAFTGRKILHRSICGDMTQGDSNIFNASRDLFELLHLFPQFRSESMENFVQLLTHVAVKKSLFRKTASEDASQDDQWHVGILLPGPNSKNGERRWYYNEAFTDDSEGNVNYVMLPACDGYTDNEKPLPMIKALRSTASNGNAVDGIESMVADINPYGSPNSLIPDNAYAYERKYFDERTIPTWVGYLLLGDKTNSQEMYAKALEEYLHCINAPGNTPEEKRCKACELKDNAVHMDTRDFLYQEATYLKELPEFKIAQDIYWIGHSLGAGLAQFGVYYWGPRRNRIPMEGCTYYCYASRGPAIDTADDAAFMAFGRKHKDLIVGLNQQKWINRQDLEYGDFVPEGGQSHLGTTNYDSKIDDEWLENNITVFKPLETATSIDITTHSTHGRRTTGNALEGKDFTVKKLSVEQFAEFDHSWWMTADLIETFGFRILRSTILSEYVRETFARITYPFWRAVVEIYNFLFPPFGQRDNKGVWNMNYVPPTK